MRNVTDLRFSENSVMYGQKIKGASTLVSVATFFRKKNKTDAAEDAIANGNRAPIAVMLLSQENADRSKRTGIAKLRLAWRDQIKKTVTQVMVFLLININKWSVLL